MAENWLTLNMNCKRMGERDNIRVNGKRWKDWQYRNAAIKVFSACNAVESFDIGCEMDLNGETREGIVRFNRNGMIHVRMA